MIANISGRLIQKGTESVVIDVNGVGYELFIPLSTFYTLPGLGEQASLRVYTHVREDAIQLYGFLTQDERDVFGLLIGVSGVGPKLARNILSGIAVADLVSAIGSADSKKLSSIPGIGGKSAERLIGGQSMQPDTLEKIESARKYTNQTNHRIPIAVDGGVKPENAVSLVQAGADILIMGTALFRSIDMAQTVRSIRESLAESQHR